MKTKAHMHLQVSKSSHEAYETSSRLINKKMFGIPHILFSNIEGLVSHVGISQFFSYHLVE